MTEVNAELKEHNARLAATINLSLGRVFPTLMVEKIAPRGKRPPAMVPSFCPFCGEKYMDEDPS